ncbi:glutathione transport system permease protein [Acidipila rosea]|uniref:Glutathione transport system permease protein n=2 Tax=Acidipila rosea TaxID=768535 RepID=A0A4R1KWN2_9BACT|nr:glutathione transport system permease protein [Acidipila rosea]
MVKMRRYWIRKLLALPMILLVASFLIFAAVRLLPGDPARLMAGMQADQQSVNAARTRLGLDKPFAIQYGLFLRGVLHGDLGISIRSHKPVEEEIAQRFPFTLALTSVSYLFAIAVGITSGVLAALYAGSAIDHAVMVSAIAGASIANYWLALMAMNLFAVQLGWLPLLGADSWKNYILPAITLGLLPAAVIARMCRASMLEILNQDYMRTARAKGLTGAGLYIKHGLRNALIPIVTIAGMNFGSLLGGAVITETVFNWPGLGRLMVDAVRYRDYATIQGITLLTVALVTLINLIVEVMIGVLDPRIRFE